MILSALIIFNLVTFSSVYGQLIINNPEWFNVITFHTPMVAFDSLGIKLLSENPVPALTTTLVVLLSFSIINHAMGAVAWLTYNHDLTDVYDSSRKALLAFVILAFARGWLDRHLNRKRALSTVHRVPRLHVVEKN